MASDLIEQAVATWRTNNQIDLFLLRNLREGGLDSVTLLKDGKPSKGRTVARVFAHLHNVRLSWVGAKAKKGIGEFPSAKEEAQAPDRAALEAALGASGKAVEEVLREVLVSGGTVKRFDGPPLLWLGYLLAHEAHHRGQIVLALKQSGLRLPDEIAYGLWTYWGGYIYRKDNRVPPA